VSILEDEAAVRRLIARYANCLDAQAWDELGECIADSVYTDFSDLRGTPPNALAREAFVATCRSAVQAIKTHHMTGNVEAYINGTSATARVSALIFRRNEAGQVAHYHCLYLLGFESRDGQWSICSIVHRTLWSD
jgi:hypothetical protein